jgi:riboflavin kinase/FMN adenylyltransferase
MEQTLFSLGEIPSLSPKLTLCLGNFDGVHLGHQALIQKAQQVTEGDVGVLLFDQNPAQFFPNGKSLSVLTSLEDKCRLFASYGVERSYIVKVSRAFFALSPEDFIADVLSPLKPEILVVGSDYSFGKNAAGNLPLLKKHFRVEEVPLLEREGKKISTQAIIKAIQEGKIQEANAELGRPYEVHGLIAHGLENGRKIGFPTANLHLSTPYVLPKAGVYLGIAYLRGIAHRTLINVGKNPTIGVLSHPIIEAYLEHFQGEAYGETLYLDFLSFVREEKKFATLDELQAQIERDKQSLLK